MARRRAAPHWLTTIGLAAGAALIVLGLLALYAERKL
jgi:hypothetical protein